ncbi:cytochrome c family protein [Duganella sp. sic0402]|uniref:c-type cytochrome n=1 Tax=Duganella sp. sic0402 TaxID=2854786 RepID=UPI0035A3CB4C
MRILLLLPLAWLAACDSGGPAPARVEGGSVARGRVLLAQYQCGACHQIAGVAAARGQLGPPLDSFGQRSYIAGSLPNTPDLLRHWLIDPPALKPGTTMPAMGVSEDDARHMAAYLYSLP